MKCMHVTGCKNQLKAGGPMGLWPSKISRVSPIGKMFCESVCVVSRSGQNYKVSSNS